MRGPISLPSGKQRDENVPTITSWNAVDPHRRFGEPPKTSTLWLQEDRKAVTNGLDLWLSTFPRPGSIRADLDRRLIVVIRQVNLNNPPIMLRRKSGSVPPVGVVRET